MSTRRRELALRALQRWKGGRGSARHEAARTRRQRLLQLVSLVGVGDAQRVQVLAAANLELGRARRLLDLDGCEPHERARASACAAAAQARRLVQAIASPNQGRAGRARALGHAQRASFLRAVSRKSLISIISFGCTRARGGGRQRAQRARCTGAAASASAAAQRAAGTRRFLARSAGGPPPAARRPRRRSAPARWRAQGAREAPQTLGFATCAPAPPGRAASHARGAAAAPGSHAPFCRTAWVKRARARARGNLACMSPCPDLILVEGVAVNT
jgi:hypothetical protein